MGAQEPNSGRRAAAALFFLVAAAAAPATLLLFLLLLQPAPPTPPPLLPPSVRPSESEPAYIARTLARLVAHHTCSGGSIPLSDDPAAIPPVPRDAVALLRDVLAELRGFGLTGAAFSQERGGAAVVATLPESAYRGAVAAAERADDGPPSSASGGTAAAGPGFCGAPARAASLVLAAHVDQACAHDPTRTPVYDGSGAAGVGGGGAPGPSRSPPVRPTPVRPRVFPAWDGAPIPFPDSPIPGLTFSLTRTPRAADALNRTLILGSGGSPLGADGLGGAVALLALARRASLARAAWALAATPGAGRAARKAAASAPAPSPPTLWSSDPASLPLALPAYPPHGPLRLVFTPGGETASTQFLLGAADLTDGGRLALGAAFYLDAEVPGDVRYESPAVTTWAVRFDAPSVQSVQGSGRPGTEYPAAYGLAHCDPRLAAARFVAALADDPSLGIEVAPSGGRAPTVSVVDVSAGPPVAVGGGEEEEEGGGGAGESWPPVRSAAEGTVPVDAARLVPRPPPGVGGAAASTAAVTLRVSALDEAAEAAAAAGIHRLVAAVLAGYAARSRPRPACMAGDASPLTAPPLWRSGWDLAGRNAGPVRLARAAWRGAASPDGRPPPPPVSTPTRHITDGVPWAVAGLPTILLASGWHAAHGPLE